MTEIPVIHYPGQEKKGKHITYIKVYLFIALSLSFSLSPESQWAE
jgi:hypothetical protein